MKLAIISLGGPTSKLILEEAKQFFDQVDNLDLRKIEVEVSTDLRVTYEGKLIDDYDCIYLRGSFRYSLLQRSITRAISSEIYTPITAESFTIGHDKFLTLLELRKNMVPLPKTYFATTTKSARKLLEEVHYPIIIKIPSGTQGKGVMFADSNSSARSMLDALEVFNQPYILQEYVETNATDIRAIVVGNKVVGAMKRKAEKSELRANVHAGAQGQPYELDADTEQIAIKSAKAIGAEICAVDILDSGGKPQVIEVNLSPGLVGIMKFTQNNIPLTIAKYLSDRTKELQKSRKNDTVNNMLRDLESNSNKNHKKEIITNLDIRSGIIRLPKIITELSQFAFDDDVTIETEKDNIKITKHKVG